MAIQTEKPIECVGCNTFDMKSLFDNSDCSLPIDSFTPLVKMQKVHWNISR